MKIKTGCKIPDWKIEHCPWNPRPEITQESVADLAASIKAKGLLQEIGVMRIPNSEQTGDEPCWWAIYGNRRLVACRVAGVTSVPVKIYEDINQVEARELTRIENEQRLGVSPIEDAKLIKSMLDLGFEEQEIAAHFGVSNATVCRRVKLTHLEESYYEIADKIATCALERIALYPEAVQDKCFNSVKQLLSRMDRAAGWSEIAYLFDRELRSLDGSNWAKDWKYRNEEMKSKCAACPKRTGAQADLWGDVSGEFLGQCLDADCFVKTNETWKLEAIKSIVSKKATGVKQVSGAWDLPSSGIESPNKGMTFAYWHFNDWCSDPFKVVYAESPEVIAKREEEAERAKDEERQKSEEEREKFERLRKKIFGWVNSGDPNDEDMKDGHDNLRDELVNIWSGLRGDELWRELAQEVFRFDLTIGDGYSGIDSICCTTDRERVLREFEDGGVRTFVDCVMKYYGSSLRENIFLCNSDESKCCLYWAVCQFKGLKEILTSDEFDFIKKRYEDVIDSEKETSDED